MSPEVHRLLRLKVPVIIQLARSTMPIARIRRLSVGTIIEFEQVIDEHLSLMVNNRPIGQGEAVKCGENYGLRLHAIADPADRIRSLGK